MTEKKTRGSGIYIIAITAFFLGCFLLLVIFGTGIYSSIAGRQSANNQERTVLAYLLTVTKMNEADISVVEDENYGNVLIVEDTGTGYGNRIYISEGYLVEDYGRVDGALMPDYATRIGESAQFEAEKISGTLLKLITDQGNVFVHIRKSTE